MGGNDSLATQLNYVFEMSKNARFLSSYVSYANQPGCSNAHVFSHVGKPWLTQYWVRQVAKQTYGDITPERGYGENDEDQGQMAGISALMAMGLFSLDGGSAYNPMYDITSPVFNEITIRLDSRYYKGNEFKIKVHDTERCIININCRIPYLSKVAFWNYGLAINQTRNGELNNDLGISLNLHDDSKKGCA